MAEQQFIFRSTEPAAMIEGCRFSGGVFITNDPERASLLRKSYFYGKSLVEETPVLEPEPEKVEETPVKKPVINPKPKPQTKSKKK